MHHIKLPKEIMTRVRSHNEFVLHKYHGLDETEILRKLPQTIKTEIMEGILSQYDQNILINS